LLYVSSTTQPNERRRRPLTGGKEQSAMTTQTWNIDSSHSSIHFSVRHLVIAKVRGQFARWSGVITVEDGDLARAKVSATIDVASIETGVAQFPEMTFKSTRVEAAGKDHWKLIGDLTLHGTTKEVTLQVEHTGSAKDPWGNQRLGFTAKGELERKEFGLLWNQTLDAGGVMIGDKVNLEIDLEAVQQVEKAA
jgi:polyisoprenoid-binding protein YceI